MSNIMKTPDNASVTELLRVQRRYQSPSSSMEAFILHGANAALKEREHEHLVVRGIASSPESPTSMVEGQSPESAEFDLVIQG
jgi:hypothetical protein